MCFLFVQIHQLLAKLVYDSALSLSVKFYILALLYFLRRSSFLATPVVMATLMAWWP
jgi:hypothetical protein